MPARKPPKSARTPELALAEGETLACLARRHFAGAALAVAAYEARQPTSRGIGIDWKNYDPRGVVDGLSAIYAADALPRIQTAAAMMYLWGASRPRRRWLARDSETGTGDTADEAAHALVLRAYKAQQDGANVRASKMFGFDVAQSR
jgi:hypothetical protein